MRSSNLKMRDVDDGETKFFVNNEEVLCSSYGIYVLVVACKFDCFLDPVIRVLVDGYRCVDVIVVEFISTYIKYYSIC